MRTLLQTLFFFLLVIQMCFAQGVGINTTGTAADASAILDVSSTTKGFLPPRLTTAERDAIVSPTAGLFIFNSSTLCINYFNGTSWFALCGVYDGCCQSNGGSSCSVVTALGMVCGDNGGGNYGQIGCGSAWFDVTVYECDTGILPEDLTVSIVLSVPSGKDYDLYIYNDACESVLGSSTLSGDNTEFVSLTWTDILGSYDLHPITIEVREITGGDCADWQLVVTGNP